MTPAEILKNIQAAGVAVALHDGVLRCRPKPTGELLNMIREHKADIIAEPPAFPILSAGPAKYRNMMPLFGRNCIDSSTGPTNSTRRATPPECFAY